MELEHLTFELPQGTFHALQGGDPDGRPTLFLHGFPDHPPESLTCSNMTVVLFRRGPWTAKSHESHTKLEPAPRLDGGYLTSLRGTWL